MKTLAVKYRPNTFDELSGQGYTVDILKNQLKTGKIKQAYLFAGASGCGKALENSTPVLTMRGWKPIGDITINDNVYGDDGKLYKVVGVYPQAKREVGYEVEFTDGTKIICSGDHVWRGHYTQTQNTHFRENRTTKELHEYYKNLNWNLNVGIPRFRIDRCAPIEFESRQVSIPPRLFGILLSTLRKLQGRYGYLIPMKKHTAMLDELKKYGITMREGRQFRLYGKFGMYYTEAKIDEFGYFSKFENTYLMRSLVNGNLGHIPDLYLYNDKNIRKELLVGLLYTSTDDGSVFRLNSQNENFVESFRELGRGLGCNVPVFMYKGKVHRIQIIPNDEIHRYIRKFIVSKGLQRDKNVFTGMSIVWIEKRLEACDFTCIEVNSPNHLYVIKNYIVTHNTTAARIFARELGDKTEIIEMDAASNSGVENIRRVIEEASYKSMLGGKKVYIIDECHALSSQAWQSLLKILEEPPLNVIFIFCTTEPNKVPAPIQNRLMRFNFTRLEMRQIFNRLKEISKNERILVDDTVLEYIAKASNGGMRDAIAHLEKCVNSDLDLTIENVCSILSLTAYSDLFQIIRWLLARDLPKIIQKIHHLYMEGNDLKRFVNQLMVFLVDLLKYYHTRDVDLIDIPNDFLSEIDSLQLDTAKVSFLKNVLLDVIILNSKILYEAHPKPFLEMFFMGVGDDRAKGEFGNN